MLISDVIREAANEHEIYFLLTAYVEAVRYCDKLGALPGSMRELPFTGLEDVRARAEALHRELARPGAVHGREDRAVIQEAMFIFSLALSRLEALESRGVGELLFAA